MLQINQMEFLHCTPRRTRLRVPGQRGRGVFFTALQRRLASCDGVERVAVNPAGASVIVHHAASFNWSTVNLRALGMRCASVGAGRTQAMAAISRSRPVVPSAVAAADRGIQRATAGQADLPGLAIQLGMIALTKQPAVALFHWIAEAWLKAAFRDALAPKMDQLRLERKPGA